MWPAICNKHHHWVESIQLHAACFWILLLSIIFLTSVALSHCPKSAYML
uniref:Uncharacterized protein n=1 Tax=Rhizophora mucronata TaxID=61149 RepID=A0A2P2QCX4_RHIMU